MPHTKKHLIIFFAVTLGLKIALAIYFSHLVVCQLPERKVGSLAVLSGDTFSYLNGMDNLLETGDYFFWNGQRKVYAGRMPHYGTPYFIARLFFSPSQAADIYALLQIIIDALANVVLARLCYEVSRRRLAFWLGWTFYFCSFSFAVLSVVLLPESLSLGFFIFFLFFYHRFWAAGKWRNALQASVFLALLTVLKPYFVIVYPLFLLGGWLVWRRHQRINFLNSMPYFYRTAMLGLPLLLLLSPWIVRNAVVLGKFIPAQEDLWAGYDYSKAHLAFANFAGAWGGGSIFWDAADAGCYFLIENQSNCRYSVPEYALTNGYNREEIERVRQNFLKLQRGFSPELNNSTAAEFERLTNIYREEQPFRYYIGAKFIFLKKLFWHTNSYNLPIHPSFECFSNYQLLFKAIQFGIYALALTLGSVGLVILTIRGKVGGLFILIALVTIFFFIELRTSEQRYVSHVFPILLIGLAAFFGSRENLTESLNAGETSQI